MPAHALFRELIERSGRPLAAPSANPFGYISPTTAGHVRDGLGRRIAYILDGGPAEIGVESTILDLRDSRRPALLRPGSISRVDLERVLGCKVAAYAQKAPAHTAAPAPGMLERHYSPRTPLSLRPNLSDAFLRNLPSNEAVLFVHQPKLAQPAANVFWLANTGADLAAAAHHLFDQLRTLDSGQWTQLYAQLAPGKSALALAINDRLTRAAAKRGLPQTQRGGSLPIRPWRPVAG
jgi:L-threonylcarbamoyladenylate synthase